MQDELVSVMVPKRFLAKVYGYISGLESEADGPKPNGHLAGEGPHARTQDEIDEEWTSARTRRMVEESPPAMRDILRLLATQPGQWLSTEDLARGIQANSDANWNTVAGTLGAFGRRLKSRYGLEIWPFEWRRDFDVKGMVYRMSPQMAKRVLEYLKAS